MLLTLRVSALGRAAHSEGTKVCRQQISKSAPKSRTITIQGVLEPPTLCESVPIPDMPVTPVTRRKEVTYSITEF